MERRQKRSKITHRPTKLATGVSVPAMIIFPWEWRFAGTASLPSEVGILRSQQECWSVGHWAIADFREG